MTKATNDKATSWTDERVDNLAALITVTDEQLADRERIAKGLESDTSRVRQLVSAVFGGETPSVEQYLRAHDDMVAA